MCGRSRPNDSVSLRWSCKPFAYAHRSGKQTVWKSTFRLTQKLLMWVATRFVIFSICLSHVHTSIVFLLKSSVVINNMLQLCFSTNAKKHEIWKATFSWPVFSGPGSVGLPCLSLHPLLGLISVFLLFFLLFLLKHLSFSPCTSFLARAIIIGNWTFCFSWNKTRCTQDNLQKLANLLLFFMGIITGFR